MDNIVTINNNQYRYRYNPDTKATEYLGPVGDSPPISEEHFLTVFDPPTLIADTSRGVLEFTPTHFQDEEIEADLSVIEGRPVNDSDYYILNIVSQMDLPTNTIKKMMVKNRDVRRVTKVSGKQLTKYDKAEKYRVGDIGEVIWLSDGKGKVMLAKKIEWKAVALFLDNIRWKK